MRAACVGQLTAQLLITQFHCYYNVVIIIFVNQSSAKIKIHISINHELKIECENELDYSILDN